jgi:hypothetical protein
MPLSQVPDGVCNPVRNVFSLFREKRYGAGCKPAPAKRKTLRSRLQTCSSKKYKKCRTGFATPSVTFFLCSGKNVTEQVANLLQQKEKRYGAGCKPAPAKNIKSAGRGLQPRP